MRAWVSVHRRFATWGLSIGRLAIGNLTIGSLTIASLVIGSLAAVGLTSTALASTLQVSSAAAFRGSFGLRLTLTACTGDAPELDITGPPLTVTAVFEACNRLTSDVDIEAPADVTLRSGREIELRNGFDVAGGAQLRAEVDPGLSTLAYLQDGNPSSEQDYYARWYLDLSQMSLATDSVVHFAALGTGQTPVLELRLDRSAGQDRATLAAFSDGGGESTSTPVTVAGGWVAVEVEWHASSGADDGELRLYLDDVQVAQLTGLDNDTLRIDAARLGASGFGDGTASGEMDIDEFSSRNDGRIGL